jgi:hypothetical protein
MHWGLLLWLFLLLGIIYLFWLFLGLIFRDLFVVPVSVYISGLFMVPFIVSLYLIIYFGCDFAGNLMRWLPVEFWNR